MKNKKIDFRNSFFDEMYKISKKNNKIVFLTADISAYSLPKFRKDFPNKFYNVGIAEQGMINIATGLAMNNKKVFIFSMIPFLTMRCYEHIKINLCSHNLPVVLVGLGSGLSYDTAGHSAQAIIDIGIMRMLPELEIFNPSDPISTKKICEIVSKSKKPTYVRLDKSQQKILYSEKEEFNSDFKLIKQKSKNCIITTGIMTHKSIEITNFLNLKNLNMDIIDLIKLKPINEKKLINSLKKYRNIFVLDENTFSGGIGSILSEIFIKNNFQKKINFYCLNNTQDVGFYGNREWLHARNRLDTKYLTNIILKKLKK
jgi:transketolase